ncbi:hypothetical protein KDH83_31830, partial [Achromobacter sp. Marseille-Q0513]|nr:hypothetical protein [Achromobacter sp. Marseille-Q0513]
MTVQVSNLGDRPEYVSVALSRLLNPGVPLPVEELEAIGDTPMPGLYATPFRLSLAPGQSKFITLKPLNRLPAEQAYRLVVRPEKGVLGTGRDQTAGVLVVNIAY